MRRPKETYKRLTHRSDRLAPIGMLEHSVRPAGVERRNLLSWNIRLRDWCQLCPDINHHDGGARGSGAFGHIGYLLALGIHGRDGVDRFSYRKASHGSAKTKMPDSEAIARYCLGGF
jgi:hypothetical protein